MNCEAARSFLLDHGLYKDDMPVLRKHLAHLDDCSECRSALAGYSSVKSLLRDEEGENSTGIIENRVPRPPFHKQVWRLPTVFKVAAAILLLVGAYMTGAWQREASTVADYPEKRMAGTLSADSVRDLTLGFGEVAEVFNGQARWLLLSDTKADVGLEALPGTGSGRVLVLRVTLLRDGIPQKTADVAMLSGSSLSKRLPLVGGKSLQLALSANDNAGKANVSLWAEVQDSQAPSARSAGAVSAEMLLLDGETVPAGRFRGAEGEYEVRLSYASIPAGEAAL
jgi:hypothetical protein